VLFIVCVVPDVEACDCDEKGDEAFKPETVIIAARNDAGLVENANDVVPVVPPAKE
jgi:hypothetical protein